MHSPMHRAKVSKSVGPGWQQGRALALLLSTALMVGCSKADEADNTLTSVRQAATQAVTWTNLSAGAAITNAGASLTKIVDGQAGSTCDGCPVGAVSTQMLGQSGIPAAG